MEKLWELPESAQTAAIEQALKEHGSLIGQMTTPHSRIFTFDFGPNGWPRYVVAKALRLDPGLPDADRHRAFSRMLEEINNAYTVCYHPSVQRFADIQIVLGVPVLLARKRDATLYDIIQESALPEAEALSITIQIVHALIYCASKGLLCHQDIKPENIFIDFWASQLSQPEAFPLQYRALVADFELANAFARQGRPYGSRPYMAPEQYSRDITGSEDFSKVDVFAVGIMLFEMLTGGLHPIGERTSLVWPEPSPGQSRKWERETPWKKWLKSGAAIAAGSQISDEALSIIRDCTNVDFNSRLSRVDCKQRLLTRLRTIDPHVHATLLLNLDAFDRYAAEGQAAGWPYFADRLAKLNASFG